MTTEKQKKVSDIAEEAQAYKCPLRRALHIVEGFLDGPMCGKCFPCSMGSYEARIRLQDISERNGSPEDAAALASIAEKMGVMSMCKKGKDVSELLRGLMAESGGFREHVENRACPDHECEGYIEYRNVPEKCIMCGDCQTACKYGAIFGEKRSGMQRGYRPFEIRQKRCVKCGECIKVCPTNAIVIVNIETDTSVGV